MDIHTINSLLDDVLDIHQTANNSQNFDWDLVVKIDKLSKKLLREYAEWVAKTSAFIADALYSEFDTMEELYTPDDSVEEILYAEMELNEYGEHGVTKAQVEADINKILSTLTAGEIIEISNWDTYINLVNTYNPIQKEFFDWDNLTEFAKEFFDYILDGKSLLEYLVSIVK